MKSDYPNYGIKNNPKLLITSLLVIILNSEASNERIPAQDLGQYNEVV